MAVKKAVPGKSKKSVAKPKPVAKKVKGSSPASAKAKAAPAKTVKASSPKVKAPAPKESPKKTTAPAAASERPTVSSGLSKSDLEHYRKLLLEKRAELLGDMGSMETEAFKTGANLSNMPIHMADVGTDNFEQEFTLGLIESERQTLREIHDALKRIENGTFGICQATGKPIGQTRLEATPWAKFCIEHARALESGQGRRDNGSRSVAERDEDED